jgi:hypothetical protein
VRMFLFVVVIIVSYLCLIFFQALHLTKSQDTHQVTRVAELEKAHALLRVELDTAHSKMAEVEHRERTLTSENDGL